MNKIFAIVITVILSLPVGVWAVDELPVPEEAIPVETIQPNEEEIVEPASTSYQYKQPISKRKIAFKFLAAMGGVALSSFLIFILLTMYNRIKEGVTAPTTKQDEIDSLETPNDYESAIKTFLDKTDWKN